MCLFTVHCQLNWGPGHNVGVNTVSYAFPVSKDPGQLNRFSRLSVSDESSNRTNQSYNNSPELLMLYVEAAWSYTSEQLCLNQTYAAGFQLWHIPMHETIAGGPLRLTGVQCYGDMPRLNISKGINGYYAEGTQNLGILIDFVYPGQVPLVR